MPRGNSKKHNSQESRPGRLRIVAGKWRSRLLPVPVVPGLRPTSERIRETLFNWLGHDLVGSHCLDLFAGTGALGLEALSRGAESVVFVESSSVATKALRISLAALEANGGSIRQTDALAFLRTGVRQRFNIVFLDPPFAADLGEDLCRLLAEGDWLAPAAQVYFEQDRTQATAKLPASWSLVKEKTAGNVRYSLFRAA